MVRHLANGTESGKSCMVNGTVSDQFCYSQFIACHIVLSKQSKHVQAAIRCSQGQGTDAVRVHTSLTHYVEGSKLQLDQSFRLQTFIHGSDYICARSLSPIRANCGLLSLCSTCGLYSTHLFKKNPDFGTS